MRRLDGRTAIVTGASRGIGLAIAQRLVDDGARVVITGRTDSTLSEAVDALGGPRHAVAVVGRADDADHQDNAVARALVEFGSADLLVNNTGINPTYGPMIELDLEIARKIVEVNCIAASAWTQAVHRVWMADHGGAIVNVASVAAIRAAPGSGCAARRRRCWLT